MANRSSGRLCGERAAGLSSAGCIRESVWCVRYVLERERESVCVRGVKYERVRVDKQELERGSVYIHTYL